MAGALAAFYQRVKVGHVEAGLRTYNIQSPYPEELNRQVTSKLANLHFAPTKRSRENLLQEGVADHKVYVTGNTVIDALQWVLKNIPVPAWTLPFDPSQKRIILVTGHRRESFGDGFQQICEALQILSKKCPDVQIVYPVHLNPNVLKPVHNLLKGLPNVYLVEPLDYPTFVHLMNKSCLILTDSGGVQEEAPSLGKPVLVMRDTTERPEAIEFGKVKLVGTKKQQIVDESLKLLVSPESNFHYSKENNPFGDGNSSEKITEILSNNS